MSKNNYIVAATKPWSIKAFRDSCKELPNWYLITKKKDLNLNFVNKIKPRYIFFPHWNWIVPNDILCKYESVCFHMTDVPYGRGGSPLQNLILRGHTETKLTALQMTNQLDAGPIYLQDKLSLEGSAEEIYNRAANQIMKLSFKLANTTPLPKKQKGKVTIFKRRNSSESEIKEKLDINQVYDFIRMLDAETYPKAFINYMGLRFEFENAKQSSNKKISARVTITGVDE